MADNYMDQDAPKQGFRIMPYSQNDNFTGRESLCARLAEILSKSGHRRVALYGLGGVGYVPVLDME